MPQTKGFPRPSHSRLRGVRPTSYPLREVHLRAAARPGRQARDVGSMSQKSRRLARWMRAAGPVVPIGVGDTRVDRPTAEPGIANAGARPRGGRRTANSVSGKRPVYKMLNRGQIGGSARPVQVQGRSRTVTGAAARDHRVAGFGAPFQRELHGAAAARGASQVPVGWSRSHSDSAS